MNKDKNLRAEGAKSRTKLRFVILFQIEQGAWGKMNYERRRMKEVKDEVKAEVTVRDDTDCWILDYN